MTRPGYKTTEFWLTALFTLATMVVASGALAETHVAVKIAAFIAGALTSLGYGASRGFVKAKTSATPGAELLEPEDK